MHPRCFQPDFLCRIVLPLLLATIFPTLALRTEAQTTTVIPNTPVGKQLTDFLTALNTGKRATLRAFIESNFQRPQNVPSIIDDLTDQNLQFYHQSYGFVVRKIKKSSSAAIKALAQANSTGAWMEIALFITAQPPDYVQAAPPYHIVGLGFSDIEAPIEFLSHHKLTESQLRAKTDALMTALVAEDAFSGTLYVAKNGRPIYAKAFGLASKAWNAPNRVDTRFNLASITKMFTAVAVAQLVEQGKLSYGDTVGKVLPDYPNREVAQKVTVHHLLSHTSGLIGGRALVEKSPPSPTARTIAEMILPFLKEPLSFPPGQQFDYSNAGFILLGAIIEKVSGQSYYDYVRDHIFRPAGMTNTDFYELDTDPPNLATGFEDGPLGTRRDNIFDLEVKGSPAAGAYSTGEDMTRFYMALIQHKLLSKPSLETLWTGVTEDPDRNDEYGYGAQIAHYNGTRIVGHGGGWKGVTNQFDMYPELGYTVVILSNYDDDPAIIANKLREWLTQGTSTGQTLPSTPPVITMAAEISSARVTKDSPITIAVTVKNSGGTAHASVVDMEVKDASGTKVNQQFTMGQRIEAGQCRTYTYSWTPTHAGTYTVDIGAFGTGWTPKYRFESSATTITVQ
jgi:CubicO group peptidase (beta-lactamase class C family)